VTGVTGPLAMCGVDLGPGVRAGFTTRAGGASPPPWDSLNLGLNVDDDPDRVQTNRALVGSWAGSPVAWAHQVHGARVLLVAVSPTTPPGSVGSADALVTSAPGVAVGVLVADCVPVLLADADAGVVAAVHAGRRGLVDGVVQNAVAAMIAHGADPDRLRAVVGPAICGSCYEVPAAMREEVADVVPAAYAVTSWGTPALDLPAGVIGALDACGVRHRQRLDLCTMTDVRFFSHRRAQRAGSPTGRFAGVVRAPGVSS
jgi:YfiH family protein